MRVGAADRGAAAPASLTLRRGRWIGVTALAVTAITAIAGLAPVAVATTTASDVTAPDSPTGAIGIQLVDDGLNLGNDPRMRRYLVDHRAPDSVASRTLEITNTTASAAHIQLYAAGAFIEDGAFVGSDGRAVNTLSSWTAVVPSDADLPAGGRITATVAVDIPRGASPGEKYAAIWAESRTAGADGVIHVSRVGLRMYISVGVGAEPSSGFAIDALVPGRTPDGRAVILAAVHNTGGRALDMSGSLELRSGPDGARSGPYAATAGTTVAIGETELVEVALVGQLAAGPWDARIALSSGLVEQAAQATVEFPDAGSSSPILTTSIRPAWLYPAIAGALMIMLVAVACLVLGHRRRRLRRWGPDEIDDAMPDSLEVLFTR